MKTIDAFTVIDFLRRISETNNLDKIEISSVDLSKYICYTISKGKYISLYIYQDDNIKLVVSEDLEKEIEFTSDEKTELFYYFNKIHKAKENQVYEIIDKACRYKATDIDFV